jgi:hypothetical protein
MKIENKVIIFLYGMSTMGLWVAVVSFVDVLRSKEMIVKTYNYTEGISVLIISGLILLLAKHIKKKFDL